MFLFCRNELKYFVSINRLFVIPMLIASFIVTNDGVGKCI